MKTEDHFISKSSEINFSSFHWAAWPGGLSKPHPNCIVPEIHTETPSDSEVFASRIKLAYNQRSRSSVSYKYMTEFVNPICFPRLKAGIQ